MMAATDNLSFYHKVLLPGLLIVLVGMGGTQVMVLQSIARLEEKVSNLTAHSQGMYSSSQAVSDWKLQERMDGDQNKRLDSLEVISKSQSTQLHNIRKSTAE